MPHADFVHLHLHTQYSLLDGACRIPELLALAVSQRMDSLAITDHGSLFGAIEFYTEAQKAGIKPIIGCEVYVAPKSRFDKSSSGIEESSYHLILLARDETGYRNLMKLVSSAFLEGFYYRPRIDKDLLSAHAQGLIGLSACLKGEVSSLLTQRRFNDALKTADRYAQIFGKDNYYLELQENGISEQAACNAGLVRLARELSLPLVATNDVHYLTREAAKSHDALLCIQTQTTLDDPGRMRMQSSEFFFKSPQEMKELFRDYPQAISNTLEIASRCNLELEFGKPHLPRYEPPGGIDKEAYLRSLCEEGLKRRFAQVTPEITARLDFELRMIKQMGFVSYFLIVWDLIHYAKSRGVPVGPGRGSAAGSLVSFLLGITDINPLTYGLLFERFLNPQRIGLPDIDIDFCYERRPEVIEYVTRKYGRENVAQIITFGTMQARAVVRDVGRVMGMAYADVDRIAKLIPAEMNMTLSKALQGEQELKGLYEGDSRVHELMDDALNLEGLNRHASVHAAGVVISDKPLQEYVPLFKSQDDQITTGYSMEALEKIGLLKMDFLGLRTLTVISEAVKLVRERRGVQLDIDTVTLDDEATYRLLRSAETIGIFQLESTGMRDLLRKMEPSKFEDLIALLALYRPGPIGSGMLDDFIKRKRNRIPIKYEHPSLEPILRETYGIMVYQEQIMQVASSLAGFSLAQADLLRKAMGKKIPEVMEKERKNFVLGCIKNNIKESIASKIFDLIEYFSGYGFNKSHSAAYALISYRTAYLKANFPVEFMTALLTSERDNTDKIVEYVAESNRMGISVEPPDINQSDALFTVISDTAIRFGLIAVKNVGRAAIDSILAARRSGGAFASLQDFCGKIDLRQANRKVMESLIKCGALDGFKLARARMVSGLDTVMEQANRLQRDRSSGQLSFFDQASAPAGFSSRAGDLPMVHEWPEPQVLAFEKEMLGFYVSGHPLARYANQIKRFASTHIAKLAELKDEDEVKVVGLIEKIKHTVTRAKQERMAILKVEDLEKAVEVLVFPQTYQKVSRGILLSTVVLVKGRLNLKEEAPKIVANDLIPVDDIYKLITSIKVNLSGIRENLFESLKQLLSSEPGKVPVYLQLDTPTQARINVVVGENLFVTPSERLISAIEGLIGFEKVLLFL